MVICTRSSSTLIVSPKPGKLIMPSSFASKLMKCFRTVQGRFHRQQNFALGMLAHLLLDPVHAYRAQICDIRSPFKSVTFAVWGFL